MRLTLRTMLAYMDDILEPDDAESIGKKIEESEFATSLVHRTRDCVRRLRLAAPPLVGRGMALDANTVAEYLDNTLASERVPDFEKVCLESDVHLAEVASCHQVLTLVLGEPADVDAASRERMYQIIARVDAAMPAAKSKAAAAVSRSTTAAADGPRVVGRPKPEVPDYLREPRSRLWTVAATVLAAALLTGAVLMLMRPPQLLTQLAKMVGIKTQSREEADGPAVSRPGQVSAGASQPTRPGENQADPQGQSAVGRDSQATAPDESGATSKPGASGDEPARGGRPSGDDKEGGGRTLIIPPADRDDSPPSDAPPAPEPSPDGAAGDAAPPEPAADGTDKADTPAIEPGAGPSDVADDLGRYVSDQDVLLRFDRDSSGWQRLRSKAGLRAGDRLVSLPSFKPIVALTTGINLQPAGPSLLELEPADARGIPGIDIEYGRLHMLTVGKAGRQIRVRLGDRQGLITFGDAESTLALEVARLFSPGKDPEAGRAPIAADLYATSGQIQWEEDATPVKITAPERKTLTPLPVFESPVGELPKWITADVFSSLDKRGASDLEKALDAGRSISPILNELAGSKRVEVRSLAIRCAGYVDQFDPLIDTLNDPDQRLGWPGYVESLRMALALSPEVAAKVRVAFEKKRGVEDGRALCRMLWGYTADDLKHGAAKQLVEYLNHESLDFRVLSFSNLKTITGKTLNYSPEHTAQKRRLAVQAWQTRLAKGEIVPLAAAAAKSPAKPSSARGSKPSERPAP